MSRANPTWGAPRIHGELLKLGMNIGETSVSKYLVRHRKPPSQTWRTFLCQRRFKTTAFPPVLQLRKGHRRGGGTDSTTVSKFFASGRTVRQPPIWSNGVDAIVNESSSHRSISRGSQFSENMAANGDVAPMMLEDNHRPRCRQVCLDGVQSGALKPGLLAPPGSAPPTAVARNRHNRRRDQKRRLRDLANNNSAFELKRSAAEVWLLGSDLEHLANNNSAPAQVWILETLPPRKPPVSESCQQQRPGAPVVSAG
jgi:hypothetical protein